jgi:hypothetical protein
MTLLALLACTDSVDTATDDTAVFETTRSIQTGSFDISYAPTPDPIPFNEYFALAFTIDPVPTEFTFDATMPAHGHGMNVEPPEALDGDVWMVENALFHMTGHWELIAIADGETAVFHVLVEAN